ncbi:MAG: 4Fe-4S cluster-binding domain-containing protein, partial [Planctomycetes bacterium]|nr:4Fe-4S cluster-binding domain-containing protein [Planctomycetota bacterium]
MHFPFTMPPLLSGGVMLTYRCNHACRHCLYRCGPHLPDAWMDMVTMEKVFTALAREKQLADLHLAGGEATLNVELLVEAIRMATRMGVRLSYLETNASFADGMDQAVGILEKLHEAGLRTILISISPYHNEFTPLQKAFTCIEAGRRVFGDNRVFPWRDHFLAALGNMDIQQTHTLEKSLSHMGMRDGARELLQLFPLTPGGRVTQAL